MKAGMLTATLGVLGAALAADVGVESVRVPGGVTATDGLSVLGLLAQPARKRARLRLVATMNFMSFIKKAVALVVVVFPFTQTGKNAGLVAGAAGVVGHSGGDHGSLSAA